MDTSEWDRAHAVMALAKTRPNPDALLAALRDLQSISEDKKHRTLDELGKLFALQSIERPTIAECRAAIATIDAPHPIRNWFKEPASEKTITALVAFMGDALGRSDSGQSEAESCFTETKRKSTFLPADVNQPAWEQEYIVIEGKRRDGSRSMGVSFRLGDTEMSMRIDAPHQQRDRILHDFWRAFGSA